MVYGIIWFTFIAVDHVGVGSDYDGILPNAFMAILHSGDMGNL